MSQWRRGLLPVLDGHCHWQVQLEGRKKVLNDFHVRSHGGTEYAAVQVRRTCASHFRKSKFSVMVEVEFRRIRRLPESLRQFEINKSYTK
jgi:predicted urease superfamily metal-dependent hydrolase